MRKGTQLERKEKDFLEQSCLRFISSLQRFLNPKFVEREYEYE